MKILVTGGCGFIGSHFVRHVQEAHPGDEIVNLDALTYAGRLDNLEGIRESGYRFVHGNICDRPLVERLFGEHRFDAVVNFAAETHVDNSIAGPRVFIETNVTGTLNLLECAIGAWKREPAAFAQRRFVQISTDEVYGELPEDRPGMRFTEETPLKPSSPYSASKTGADLLAFAYLRTYGLPAVVTRCSNNYGPNQDFEKLIPLMISRALAGEGLPVYGDGKNVRDWIHVRDHCAGVDAALRRGKPGEVYNLGSDNERKNIEIVKLVLKILNKPETLIRYVADRPGHDRRYAIDGAKARRELGWASRIPFEQGLQETVQWYERKLQSARKGA